jgi:hypothetical protein
MIDMSLLQALSQNLYTLGAFEEFGCTHRMADSIEIDRIGILVSRLPS